ncbi:MAG: hypothetical protein H0Z29_12170 [Candidatus Marinimicrobia bacterium]|nr:hypothetical protein [Candidatus Neomarinimicrobiota bacterium]
MPLTRSELEQFILKTKKEIEDLRNQEWNTTDPKELKKLKRKRKQLQYLQLWHLSQLENLED